MSDDQKTDGFVITGRHVLIAMILFFTIIIVVNTIMVKLAVTSFPGEQQKKSYVQGLNFNDTLAQRKAQEQRGWRVEMVTTPSPLEKTPLKIQLVTKDGSPINRMAVAGSIYRPTTDEGAQHFVFKPIGEGQYEALPEPLTAGNWDLSIVVADDAGQPLLTAERRLWIE